MGVKRSRSGLAIGTVRSIINLGDRKPFNKRRGQDFWLTAIKEFDKSSLSLVEFCRDRGLAVSTFHSWRRRLRSDGIFSQRASQKNSKTSQESSRQTHSFLPVYVTESTLNPTPHPHSEEPLIRESVEKKGDIRSFGSSGLSLHFSDIVLPKRFRLLYNKNKKGFHGLQ